MPPIVKLALVIAAAIMVVKLIDNSTGNKLSTLAA